MSENAVTIEGAFHSNIDSNEMVDKNDLSYLVGVWGSDIKVTISNPYTIYEGPITNILSKEPE